MTEDDTYTRLRQHPIREVFRGFLKFKPENSFISLPISEITSPRVIAYLQSKGYEAEDFRDRINKPYTDIINKNGENYD